MLHEIPESHLEDALQNLAQLCIQYHANAGVSNVDALLLDYISHTLAEAHVTLKRIENRVNLLKPDTDVRTYAADNEIEYMGYGLFGSVPSQGTCGSTQQELMNEEYALYNDPLLRQFAPTVGKTIRQIILGWAEQEQISVITRSSKKENQLENFRQHTLTPQEQEILHKFNDGSYINYYYEHHFDQSTLQVLDGIWGPDARKLYYMQVMCSNWYWDAQQAYTQVLLDISWFLNQGIHFNTNVSGIAATIQNLMNLKHLNNIDLSFCPKGQNITADIIQRQEYDILDSAYQSVELDDFKDNENYFLYDKVSQSTFTAVYQKNVLCIQSLYQ